MLAPLKKDKKQGLTSPEIVAGINLPHKPRNQSAVRSARNGLLLSRLALARFSNLLGAKRITKHSHTSIRTETFSRKLGLGAQRGLGLVVRC